MPVCWLHAGKRTGTLSLRAGPIIHIYFRICESFAFVPKPGKSPLPRKREFSPFKIFRTPASAGVTLRRHCSRVFLPEFSSGILLTCGHASTILVPFLGEIPIQSDMNHTAFRADHFNRRHQRDCIPLSPFSIHPFSSAGGASSEEMVYREESPPSSRNPGFAGTAGCCRREGSPLRISTGREGLWRS